jgi:sulfite reductase alpha subunit-like flavoprotein
LRFCVLGLGDSAYYFFCEAAVKIDRRLEELGATRVLSRGAVDDMAEGGLEAGVDDWYRVRGH